MLLYLPLELLGALTNILTHLATVAFNVDEDVEFLELAPRDRIFTLLVAC